MIEINVGLIQHALRTVGGAKPQHIRDLDKYCDLLIDQIQEGKDDELDDELMRDVSDFLIRRIEGLKGRDEGGRDEEMN